MTNSIKARRGRKTRRVDAVIAYLLSQPAIELAEQERQDKAVR
jgi:hypothetical protein